MELAAKNPRLKWDWKTLSSLDKAPEVALKYPRAPWVKSELLKKREHSRVSAAEGADPFTQLVAMQWDLDGALGADRANSTIRAIKGAPRKPVPAGITREEIDRLAKALGLM